MREDQARERDDANEVGKTFDISSCETKSQILRKIAHDLNAPVAVFMMEAYTLGKELTKLKALVQQHAEPELHAQIQRMEQICINVDRVARRSVHYVSSLESAGQALKADEAA